MSMELKIYSPTEDGFIKAIEWNHEELKAELAERMQEYSTVVYGADQIKEAKADRAKLNKFLKALEDKRKEVKKQVMEPYDKFEAQMKELTGLVSAAIASIDGQVKGYEEQQQEEKKTAIALNFDDLKAAGKVPEFVELENIFRKSYLNKSVSMSSIIKDMEVQLQKFTDDAAMLSNLPEFGFEALEVYKRTLDVNKAVSEAQRMADVAKKKAAAEAERLAREEENKRKNAEEFMKNMNPPVPEEVEGQISFTDPESLQKVVNEAAAEEEPVRQWIAFEANLTTEDAMALKEFFNTRGIEFRPVQRA